MTSKKSINELVKIQDDCVQIICKKPCSGDIGPLYKSPGILLLSKMVQIELVKYGHRITHNDIPESLKKLAECNGGAKTNRFPTRNWNTPHIQKHNCHQFNISFLCKGITVYSALPAYLKGLKRMHSFVRQLKQFYLQT